MFKPVVITWQIIPSSYYKTVCLTFSSLVPLKFPAAITVGDEVVVVVLASEFSANDNRVEGHKSGLRSLVAQPFGLKLRISVDNYPINNRKNDSWRFIPT
eukprot:sb/3478710/